MAQIRLESITKDFPGGVRAVADLNLTIGDGELLVLVGPSGCGKSTTLRIVAGLENATAGHVYMDGRVADGLPPRARNVAVVFQNCALYPHLSVYDNLAFALRARRTRGPLRHPAAWLGSGAYRQQARREREAIDASVREVAQALGLQELLRRRPRQLSGGQRQRVAFGRAIVRRPAVLLLDEPFAHLDAGLRAELRSELRRLHGELHMTTLHVTHDQHEAMTLGQRVAVMRDGAVQQVGAPLELYERPANRFVAGFFGAPAMNFLPGRLEPVGEALVFKHKEDRLALPSAVAGRLRAHRGLDVVLGMRPEHLGVCAGGDTSTLSVTVRAVESLGERADVHARLASGPPLVFRAPARGAPREGERVRLHVDLAAAHWFEPGEPGRNLMLADGEGSLPN